MKEPMKLGDRVVVYDRGLANGRESGVVVSMIHGVSLHIQLDDSGSTQFFYPKQCRRLVKRNRREIWVPVAGIPMACEMGQVTESSIYSWEPPNTQTIRFVEAGREKNK